jgi:hypothetical protein
MCVHAWIAVAGRDHCRSVLENSLVVSDAALADVAAASWRAPAGLTEAMHSLALRACKTRRRRGGRRPD